MRDNLESDVTWSSVGEPSGGDAKLAPLPLLLKAMVPVSAAKVHLLNLDPIRERLGARWPRLAALVHKLFQTALRQAQGPNDRFLEVDELSYIVTFESLSAEAATLACARIAKKVSELLFGTNDTEILVRTVSSVVPGPLSDFSPAGLERLSNLLDEVGHETIYSSQAPLTAEAAAPLPRLAWHETPQGGWIVHTDQWLRKYGLSLAFAPSWDIQRRKCQSLTATVQSGEHLVGDMHHAMRDRSADEILVAEIGLLFAGVEYSHRLHKAGRVCVVTAPISYKTLAFPHLRMRYLSALKGVSLAPTCPLLVRVDEVPSGVLVGRLAELVAMIAGVSKCRVVVGFDNILTLPRIGVRLGVAGMGAPLPVLCPPDRIRALLQQATEQKAFSYLTGVATSTQRATVFSSGIRFACGPALDNLLLTGREAVPHLPLDLRQHAVRAAS